jgi:sigma-B regulation protein RsbU (phosphoserine phosphatase)
MIPAREVGGDLYDFFFINKTHLCIAIGDVSGKGVPASLLMAVTRTLLRAKAVSGISSDELMTLMDKDLLASKNSWMFVTFFLCIIDLTTGEMDYTCAGHNPPYLIQLDNRVTEMEVNRALPLGVSLQKEYRAKKLILKPGDKFLLYTDGVTEATNLEEEMFEETGLVNVLNNCIIKDTKEIVETIFKSVEQFAGEAEQADDITTLAFIFKDRLRNQREIL